MSEFRRYHPVLAILHWLLAFLVIAALALGALVMAKIAASDPMKREALQSHMAGGLIILALMLVRLFVRRATSHPVPARTGNSWLDRLAWMSHRALYGGVIAMAVSGFLLALQSGAWEILVRGGSVPADFWIYPMRTVHYVISRVLMLLIALHIAGALYHTILLRDGLLLRMWFGRRITAERSAPPTATEAHR